MWSDIAGGLFVLSGLMLVLNPERLRRKLQRKSMRVLRRYFIAAVSFTGVLLVSAGWQNEAIYAKGFTIVGVLVLLKAAHLLRTKSSEILAQRLQTIPALYLRLFALAEILLGVLIVMSGAR